MAQEKDRVVGQIFETYDYDRFTILPENRGQREKKGLSEKKLASLQRKINKGEWIHEFSRVRVNEKFQIIDGAHTFIVSKNNEKPIRYEVSKAEAFNEVSRRQLIGSVYSVNSTATQWTHNELFKAAIQCKAPLALMMQPILDENDNYVKWMDLLALLWKDPVLFRGRWREKVNMSTFEDKKLIEDIQTEEFNTELESFKKIMMKARIAHNRNVILKAVYDILWNAHELIKPSSFRKACASVPENILLGSKTKTDEGCRRMLLQHYNKSQGQDVKIDTVLYALKHRNAEPVLEI